MDVDIGIEVGQARTDAIAGSLPYRSLPRRCHRPVQHDCTTEETRCAETEALGTGKGSGSGGFEGETTDAAADATPATGKYQRERWLFRRGSGIGGHKHTNWPRQSSGVAEVLLWSEPHQRRQLWRDRIPHATPGRIAEKEARQGE